MFVSVLMPVFVYAELATTGLGCFECCYAVAMMFLSVFIVCYVVAKVFLVLHFLEGLKYFRMVLGCFVCF